MTSITHFYRETEASLNLKAKKYNRNITFLNGKIKHSAEIINMFMSFTNDDSENIENEKADIKILEEALKDEIKINKLVGIANHKLECKIKHTRVKTHQCFKDMDIVRRKQIKKKIDSYKSTKLSESESNNDLKRPIRRKTTLIKRGPTLSDFTL